MRNALVSAIGCAALLAGCRSQPSFDPDDPAVRAAIESRLQAVMDGAAKADGAVGLVR